jgi:N-acetylglucosaminyldiphosphoundecaprenol N-acetyl-beta-D-mannosaminyltransferase
MLRSVSWSTYSVAGIDIAAVSPRRAAALLAARRVKEVHLCNTYTLSEVDRDPELRSALALADMNLPDGAPIAWLGRRSGVRTVVRGTNLLLDVMRTGNSQGLSHYLYGGAPGIAHRMKKCLEHKIPGVKVVGAECPPYRKLGDDEVAALGRRISSSGAAIVWIGLGTPKQDYLVHRLAPYTKATLVPVGAAFDFISGNVKEAPKWLHGSGFEWLYRLIGEPERLWRRYLIGGPRFMIVACRHALHKKPKKVKEEQCHSNRSTRNLESI